MNRLFLAAAAVLVALAPGVAAQSPMPTYKPGGFHSSDLRQGDFWDLRLPAEGKYYYHCHPHPFMQGQIEVTREAPDSGTALISIQGFAFNPDNLRVRPNTTIRFANQDPETHTIDENYPPPTPTPTNPSGGDSPGFAGVLGFASLALVGVWTHSRRTR